MPIFHRPQPDSGLPTADPPLALDQRWPVSACQLHGHGTWPATWRLAASSRQHKKVRHSGAGAQGMPRFDICPAATRPRGPDAPAPFFRLRPIPQTLVSGTRRPWRLEICARTQHTKPHIVVPFVGIVPVPVGRTRIVWIVVPGAAAQHADLLPGRPTGQASSHSIPNQVA